MKSNSGLFYNVFAITAIITHIWTVIIGFTYGGILGGILTLLLPVIAEIYWMLKMFGVNDLYAFIALVHLILFIPFAVSGRNRSI